jgi:BMFP domain-containing protein YqiC
VKSRQSTLIDVNFSQTGRREFVTVTTQNFNRKDIMIDPKQLDELADRLSRLVPQGIKDMQGDMEKNIRAVLQSAFSKMDLVTREEFDVQAAVLQRTRTKLEALENQVAQLENQLNSSQATSTKDE